MKLFLSAGHGGSDVGAIGNGYKEADLTIELRTLVDKELQDLDICAVLDSNTNKLIHTIAYFKSLTSSDSILIDFHWNASTNPKATGTEVLVPTNATVAELQLAHRLAKVISGTLNIPMRGNYKGFEGVKSEAESHRGKLGFFTLAGNNLIVEVAFISNPNDMIKYQESKTIVSYKIAKALEDYIKKL